MVEHDLDTLAEFHMQNPDSATYSLIAHLITVLETNKEQNTEDILRNASNILGETESTRILHIMCQTNHVDYLQLMQECQTITTKHISARLLLHIAVLPIPYVSEKLEIDAYWAGKLLDQFHKHFTIDDPLVWLKNFLSITEEERQRYANAKHDLLMGRAVTSHPVDTGEYRRTSQLHHLKPGFKPPNE